jgi:hypothetical protein
MANKALSPVTLALGLRKFIQKRFGISISVDESARDDVPVSPHTFAEAAVVAFGAVGVSLGVSPAALRNKAVGHLDLEEILSTLRLPGGVFIENELSRSISAYWYRAETTGNYALFAGGRIPQTGGYLFSPVVDVWNSALVKQNNLGLSVSSALHTSTTIGDYAIFGLFFDAAINKHNKIDCFNSALKKTTLDTYQKTYVASAGRVGDYALFMAGSSEGHAYGAVNTVTCVTSSLVRSSTALSNRYYVSAGGENSTHCFIGGGTWGSTHYSVEAFNSALTKYSCAKLSSSRIYIYGAGNRNYWFVLQGETADVYNTALTKNSLPLVGSMDAQYTSAFSDRDNYAFFMKNTSLIVIDAALTGKLTSLSRDYGTGGHGTCVGKYMLGGSATSYVLVAEIS